MTPSQRAFIKEYLVDLDPIQAALRAGYAPRQAKRRAKVLLADPRINSAIAEAMRDRGEKAGVTLERIVGEYARLAFGDPRSLLSWGPAGLVVRDSTELSEEEVALVSEITETRSASGGNLRVKLHDKKAALDALSRLLGFFPEGRAARCGQKNESRSAEEQQAINDARERLARRITGIAARQDEGKDPQGRK